VRTAAAEPPLTPKLAFVKTPVWDRAAAETREAFAELAEALGAQCEVHELPESLREAWDWQRTIMEAEMAACLEAEWERGRDRLSESLRGQLARGREIRALDYQRARARIPALNAGFADLFTRFDAVLTPATTGTAPSYETTGDPVFCTLWSLCGLPALSIPLLTGGNGLPVGVRLVAARQGRRLLRTACQRASRSPDRRPVTEETLACRSRFSPRSWPSRCCWASSLPSCSSSRTSRSPSSF
jgi:Asp-tRNA(Asn)/Glu-tRNA(Gln) amidotransferase A subunit family amidase